MTQDVRAADRGLSLLDLGRAAEAETLFRQALAADPGDPVLLVYLARSLCRQERFDEARDTAQQALAANPSHLGGLVVLSAALAGLRDFDAALTVLRRGLQIDPGLAALHRQEGALLIAQDRTAEAFAPLARARALDPADADTIATIGEAHFHLGQFPEAERAAAEALRLDPDNLEAHQLRGWLALRKGGGRSAVEAHRAALRLDPTDASSREGLALAMKSRNPLYGQLLRYGDWLGRLPSVSRWLVFLAPFLLSRVLRGFGDQLWAQVLIVVVAAFVVLSWALEPVMNTVLLCSYFARNLLPRSTKVATYAFLGYVGAALVAVIVGLAVHSSLVLVLAMGLGIWSVTVGQVHLVKQSRRRVAVGLQCAGAMLALSAAVAAALGPSPADPLVGIFFVAGLPMLWFTALA